MNNNLLNLINNNYNKQKSCFWNENEIKPSNDIECLNSLSHDEKKILAYTLMFFNEADKLVIDNINNFLNYFNNEEINRCYRFQSAMEDIHQIVYNNFIETFKSNEQFLELFNKSQSSVQKKIDWIQNLINADLTIGQRIIYFICIEGILFASNFATIFWFKNENKLNELCNSNEFISRDEGLHTDFGILMYQLLNDKDKLTKDEILKIVNETIEIESKIIEDCMQNTNTSLLTKNNLIKRIKYVADVILNELGLGIYYLVDNPFEFMTSSLLEIKTNFFEKTNTAYNIFSDKLTNDSLDLFEWNGYGKPNP